MFLCSIYTVDQTIGPQMQLGKIEGLLVGIYK
jgi:hypothetical protein